jgi:hypothetical protein
MQALRLGNYLTETKPLKFLHRGDGEWAAEADNDAEPLVLKLGNYLNGASVSKPGDGGLAPPLDLPHPSSDGAAPPAFDHPTSENVAVAVSVDVPVLERAQEGFDLPASSLEAARAAAVAEEAPATVVVATG